MNSTDSLGVFEKLYVSSDLLVISEPPPFTLLIYLKLLEPYAQVLLKNMFIVFIVTVVFLNSFPHVSCG